jgi:general secretion pathway protein D
MTRLPSAVPALGLALIVFISGCATVAVPQVRRGSDPLAGIEPAGTSEASGGTPAAGGAPAQSEGPRLRPGTGQVINQRAASTPAPSLDSTGEATFNFEGESVHAVVKAILGDLLQQNYVIAPNVQGQVTLATPRPVNAAQALSLLEMVLGWNNARLVWSDGRYNVLPTDQAIAGNLSPRTGSAANARGYEVRAVPLQYISAAEMKKVLEPYARPNAVVSVDNARNLIVLAGTRSELQNYLRTVEIFDVDWLAGMSVGVFPLQSAEAAKVVDELNGVFGESGSTPVSGMFRFMPLEGQNAVLVITPQARYLREAQTWIERLDAGGGEGSRLYTYEVLYMKATDLADQLGQVFGAGSGASSSRGENNAAPSVMPGLAPVRIRSTNTPAPDAKGARGREAAAQAANDAANSPPPGTAGGEGIALGNDTDVSISAVEASNALLVRASPGQWESIRRAIERLDTMPLQVHIEAQVVEVQLTGELSYGVSWFFENAVVDDAELPSALGRTIWGDIAGSITGDGVGWTFLGRNAAAVITALDDASDVRLLSTPSVVVRNNAEARLDVGTKIPVNSTSFNPISGENPGTGNGTFTQVQYLDTGVILTVTPRISRDGTVFMEIEQEVSSPGPPRANDPTGNVPINKRSLITEAAIKSGETVMLAGLITEGTTRGSSGVPGLSRLPIVGGLFGTKSTTSDRSEVIILVTPRVIRDPAEARKLTDEYGERFRALDPIRAEPAPQR